jgi:hypothetical protein
MEVKMKNKILFTCMVLPAACLLLTATGASGVLINWGAADNPILDAVGNPLPDGYLVQLIWDRDQDGIDAPDLNGDPSDGDQLLGLSTIGHGAFYPGTFSENTSTGTVTVGDDLYVRAWNGTDPQNATHYGDTQNHTPSLWTVDSNLDFTLDATLNSSWGTQTGWTGVEEADLVTQIYSYALFQNYPNPFGKSTNIVFTVPGTRTYSIGENGERNTVSAEKKKVNLRVYDVTGRLVKRIIDGERNAGYYSIEWSGRDHHGREVSSGIYFYSLRVGENSSVRKMVLMK